MAKAKRKWLVLGEMIEAHTKSEARAIYKGRHGLKRIPVGVVIAEMR